MKNQFRICDSYTAKSKTKLIKSSEYVKIFSFFMHILMYMYMPCVLYTLYTIHCAENA